MTTRRLLAAICTTLALQSFISIGMAEALPSRASVAEELEKLGKQIAVADEEYNLARIRLAEVESEIRGIQQQKSKADAQLASLRGETSKRAVAVYRAGIPDVLMVLLQSKSFSEFGRKMGIISQVDNWQAKLMESLSITQQRADFLAAELQQELARRKSVKATIDARRKTLEKQAGDLEVLLRRIDSAASAQERARKLAARARVQAPTNLPVSGRAGTAVRTAYEQIGKPYRYGAAGPDSFDCSGLTMYSWGKAGVSLPHSSRAQYSATKRVARSELQPGDLVFFGSPIHHVGIYIGDGKMINSPETGDYVGIRSMDRRDYAGAGRPGV